MQFLAVMRTFRLLLKKDTATTSTASTTNKVVVVINTSMSTPTKAMTLTYNNLATVSATYNRGLNAWTSDFYLNTNTVSCRDSVVCGDCMFMRQCCNVQVAVANLSTPYVSDDSILQISVKSKIIHMLLWIRRH